MPANKEITLSPAVLQTLKVVGIVTSTIGAGIGAYHGYARNRSIGWALVWGFLGGAVPVIVVPVALAQGLGEPKGRLR